MLSRAAEAGRRFIQSDAFPELFFAMRAPHVTGTIAEGQDAFNSTNVSMCQPAKRRAASPRRSLPLDVRGSYPGSIRSSALLGKVNCHREPRRLELLKG